jgi:hypothetical protein
VEMGGKKNDVASVYSTRALARGEHPLLRSRTNDLTDYMLNHMSAPCDKLSGIAPKIAHNSFAPVSQLRPSL